MINYKVSVSDSTLLGTIEEYVNEFRGDDNLIRWHIIADAYLKTNNIVEAVQAINKHDESGNIRGNVYHYIASEIYGVVGDYEKALVEQEKLRAIISDKSLNPNIKKLLKQRLTILNKFIVSNISGVNLDDSVKE